MARTHRYELDMLRVRVEWLTERQEAYERMYRAILALGGPEQRPVQRPGRPDLVVLKGGRQ